MAHCFRTQFEIISNRLDFGAVSVSSEKHMNAQRLRLSGAAPATSICYIGTKTTDAVNQDEETENG